MDNGRMKGLKKQIKENKETLTRKEKLVIFRAFVYLFLIVGILVFWGLVFVALVKYIWG